MSMMVLLIGRHRRRSIRRVHHRFSLRRTPSFWGAVSCLWLCCVACGVGERTVLFRGRRKVSRHGGWGALVPLSGGGQLGVLLAGLFFFGLGSDALFIRSTMSIMQVNDPRVGTTFSLNFVHRFSTLSRHSGSTVRRGSLFTVRLNLFSYFYRDVPLVRGVLSYGGLMRQSGAMFSYSPFFFVRHLSMPLLFPMARLAQEGTHRFTRIASSSTGIITRFWFVRYYPFSFRILLALVMAFLTVLSAFLAVLWGTRLRPGRSYECPYFSGYRSTTE